MLNKEIGSKKIITILSCVSIMYHNETKKKEFVLKEDIHYQIQVKIKIE